MAYLEFKYKIQFLLGHGLNAISAVAPARDIVIVGTAGLWSGRLIVLRVRRVYYEKGAPTKNLK